MVSQKDNALIISALVMCIISSALIFTINKRKIIVWETLNIIRKTTYCSGSRIANARQQRNGSVKEDGAWSMEEV